jgi:Rieske Fe-S protein
MQPKIKSKVSCTDREMGEVSRVVVDPLTREISHLVVKISQGEFLVPTEGNLSNCTDEQVQLSLSSASLTNFPAFRREDYVLVKEVEIPHLERHLEVDPGEALVPIPALEKNIGRRTFLSRFTNTIGAVVGFSLVYPVMKYIIHPMYAPFDNSWVPMASVNRLTNVDLPKLIKYPKTVQEGFLVRDFNKSHWAVKASPELLDKIYQGKDREFHDKDGKVLWVNEKNVDIVVFSGKCPHLGCAYRWRKHKQFGEAFICPCHLSIFASSGEVLDGPSPRGLDILPVRVAGNGQIDIIDMEFKAGKSEQHRII